MEKTQPDGFNTLICEEEFHVEDRNSFRISNQSRQSVTLFTSGRRSRQAAVILVLLAGLLLILDVALGVHYSGLQETHLTLKDTEILEKDLGELHKQYETAVENIYAAQKQLDAEMNSQKETKWELEHQRKRTEDYKVLIEKVTQDLGKLRSQVPQISDGCTHCPPGWLFINLVCYYFSSNNAGLKSWQKAREFCQIYGGDLLVIDTKDKEKTIVNYLLNHAQNPSESRSAFWFGLRDSKEEGTWHWLDGTFLVEGYWKVGQPDDYHSNEDCAAVYPNENFFKAWNDLECGSRQNWICEKAPTYKFLNGTSNQ
ncbi:PREDICTED: CD209 antigen-like protein E [Poecilia mexicana]|uniref:C-type lectin domain-containing protein n=2 Tax=Poecilia mexicana TaxID=48701 RepID=A0A3B3YJK8_9TELE|nr:PREDICTED: CD209 antigen-like protein E [Poecilia mexicana]